MFVSALWVVNTLVSVPEYLLIQTNFQTCHMHDIKVVDGECSSAPDGIFLLKHSLSLAFYSSSLVVRPAETEARQSVEYETLIRRPELAVFSYFFVWAQRRETGST